MEYLLNPEVCILLCNSLVGQIVILATFLLTLYQEIRHQMNKDKIKVIKEKK